jgi:hypothetical protein
MAADEMKQSIEWRMRRGARRVQFDADACIQDFPSSTEIRNRSSKR